MKKIKFYFSCKNG